ncbi:hypothetical protein HYH03_018328 [Edaphochlamys debaryana]|uniref:Uncharacterized protein n=1 Tax=Edaphochlamys debaryana TaxID=47281 RepID=A0A835XFK2_9CHLO|nr:hypothetical protein HYH03_018328 [Edaphochlamys debaryana]|eukprot:KAG2482791.1 hypothetical protein HYH03_018328 [Edaphochlamys debaryana]
MRSLARGMAVAALRGGSQRPAQAPASSSSDFGPTLERLVSLCPRLQRLNLASNALGNDGALALARCLPACACLQELDLRGNGIGDVGLAALAGALPLVHTLEVLTIWGNHFGPGACRALAEALAQPALARLRTDVRPYVVDGEHCLALQEV